MNEFRTGYKTTPGMWQFLSEILAEAGEKLPESLNQAIYALCDDQAMVVPKQATPRMIEGAVAGDPLTCDVPEGDQAMIYGRIWDFMLCGSDPTPPPPPPGSCRRSSGSA